jgi:hypothetical protein
MIDIYDNIDIALKKIKNYIFKLLYKIIIKTTINNGQF